MNAYPTTVAALGRMAVIGDLYDARRDAFCGMSAFCKDIPDSVITALDDPDMKTEFVYTDKISDKFHKLDVSAELQVSVLGGLIKLEGSGRFLNDQKTSARSVKISLIYNIKTKQEKLNIFHDDLKDTFALSSLENDYATHIVTGISWGANSIISCTSENRENRDVKEISGKLSAFVKQATWSVEGKASVDFQTGDNSTENNFEIKVYGDILPSKEELPTTFEAALELVKQIPNLVSASNSGKGKPLAYQLTPVCILENHLKFERQIGAALQTLEEASLLRVVQFAESFSGVQQQLNDFYQDALNFRDCIQPEKLKDIGQLKHSVALLETSFRAELSSTLTSIRSGQATTSQLEELLTKFQHQEESPDNVATKIAEWSEIAEKISFAQTLSKSGAKYIGLGTSLEAELLKDFESKSLVFYFSREVKEDDPRRWTANCQIFFQEMKNEDTTCKFYAVDCDLHTSLKISGKSCFVQIFQNGKKLVEDLLEDQEKFRNTAWAQIDVNCKAEKILHKPNKRASFCVPCTADTCDPAKVYSWKCNKCLKILEFGFDTYVYCACGRSLALSLVFKCPGPKHGNTFERPDEDFLVEYIDSLRPFKELNILLLGKSGVGKSTWINCFINYLKHESLEKAIVGDLVTVVPFNVCNAVNEDIIVSAQIAENNEEVVSPPPCKNDHAVSTPSSKNGDEFDLLQSCEKGDEVDFQQSCENGDEVDFQQSCGNGDEVNFQQSCGNGDEVDFQQSCENGDEVDFQQSCETGDEVVFQQSCGNGDEVDFQQSCENGDEVDFQQSCETGDEVVFQQSCGNGDEVDFLQYCKNGDTVDFQQSSDNGDVVDFQQSCGNGDEVDFQQPCETGDEVDFQQSCENGDEVDLQQSCENGDEVDLPQSCENGDEVDFQQSNGNGDEVDFQQSNGNGDEVDFQQSNGNGDEVDFQQSCENGDEVDFQQACENGDEVDFQQSCETGDEVDFQQSCENGDEVDFQQSCETGDEVDFQQSCGNSDEVDFLQHCETGDEVDFQQSCDNGDIEDFQQSSGNVDEVDFQQHCETGDEVDFQHPVKTAMRSIFNSPVETAMRLIYHSSVETSDEVDFQKSSGNGDKVDLQQSCGNGDEVDLQQSCETGDEVDFRQSCENGDEVDYQQSSGNGDEVDFRQSCKNGDEVDYQQSSGNGDEVDFQQSSGNGDEVDFQKYCENGYEGSSSCKYNVGADFPTFCNENKDLDSRQFGKETEVDVIGTSATQTSKMYEFHVEKTAVRLIDTPGIGHHNGFDCSHTYYRNILRTLSNLQEIHGICIFLNSNDSSLSTLLEAYIQELLQVFGKDAGTNIVFCFTNTRGSFYKPGENLPVLQQHFRENDDLGIEISEKTIYCFDSEAYGYLAATKNKPAGQFSEEYLENVTESWNKSVQETRRLLEHIMGLRPHNIKTALNLDNVKETILQLTEPLADICEVIAMNINTCESEKTRMKRIIRADTLSNEDQEYVSSKTLITRKTIKFTQLKHPRVMCSNISCYNAETRNNDTLYSCNQGCETRFPVDLAGNPGLLKSFEINSGNCIYCSHSFKEHLHIYIEVDKEDELIEDQQVTDISTAFQGQWIQAANKLDIMYHNHSCYYFRELHETASTCVKFAYFLKSNTVPPCTDEMEVFLSKYKRKSNNNSNLTRFRWCASNLLRAYQAQRKKYFDVTSLYQSEFTTTAPSLEEVQDLFENLMKLKFAGPLVKEALTLIKQTPNVAYSEVPVYQTTINFANDGENSSNVFADLFS